MALLSCCAETISISISNYIRLPWQPNITRRVMVSHYTECANCSALSNVHPKLEDYTEMFIPWRLYRIPLLFHESDHRQFLSWSMLQNITRNVINKQLNRHRSQATLQRHSRNWRKYSWYTQPTPECDRILINHQTLEIVLRVSQ